MPIPFEQVRHADEARDELGARVLVDLGGRPDLLDAAAVEDREPVAHRQRLVLVVGHVDERDPDLALDSLQLDLHLLAELQVERAERLVEQEHLRSVDERAGERDALAAARELARPPPAVARQLDGRERLVDPRRRSARGTRLISGP